VKGDLAIKLQPFILKTSMQKKMPMLREKQKANKFYGKHK